MSNLPDDTLSAAKLALIIKRLRSGQADAGLLSSEPIAVIGIGCRFPGGVLSPDDYWRLLRDGEDAISEIPEDRWDGARYYSSDPDTPGKMNTRWGGFLENCDRFDASFFGISPREATVMDPQQRLLLEVAWESLWDAGIAPDKLGGTSTGVFFGLYGTDYARLLLENPRNIGPHTCAGTAHSMASGRVSFLLDLRGPSITIDTACSSSLVAVHLACQSLRAGACRLAMAGGVSLKLRPEHYLCLSKLGMTSPDGRCRTFDAGGNGFVPGEGCGVVLLKPLVDALAEGCRIYSVIRGIATNQDGRTNVLTAPSGLAQRDVVRAAIENARISPADIAYVETHGTGTPLGDPIEVEALSEALGKTAFGSRPCALGSVKTNFGHLEAASGIAGFIKVSLALDHEEIPANLHYKKRNPNVVLEGTRFFLPVERTPWPRSERGRFAGVSSFGFSGTNAHVVLEEAPRMPAPKESDARVDSRCYVLPVSARTPDACDEFARAYVSFFSGAGTDLPLYDVCHSAAVGRSHYEERLAVTAASAADFQRQLDDYIAGKRWTGLARGRATHDFGGVVFVFSGQGSQWSGMGLGLYSRFPVFRAVVDQCDALIRRFAGWSVIEALSASEAKLAHTEYAQPALFAFEVALARLWQSWGVVPSAVVGHSFGEIAAAHCAGALSLETAARIVVLRGRLMEAGSGLGKMAVIHQSWTEVAKELVCFGDRLSIACVNSPRSTVISGECASVDALVARCRERGISSRPLPVDYAFHSRQMQQSSEALIRELGHLSGQPIEVSMISTVTGKRTAPGELDATYWGRNVRETVLFASAIRTAADMGSRIYLEIGAHSVLLDSISESLETNDRVVIPSMRRNFNESASVFSGLGELYVNGCPIAWDHVYKDQAPPINLPRYPFQRQRIGVQAPLQAPSQMLPLPMHRVRSPGLAGEIFETKVSLDSLPYLADHRIGGAVLLPMTAFIEIARRAIEAADRDPACLSDFAITEALVIPDGQIRILQVIFKGDAFQILSFGDDEWKLHATGRSAPAPGIASAQAPPEEHPYEDATELYVTLAAAGADFGPAFRTVHKVSFGAGWALARIRLREQESADRGAYLLHPALLDGCLQTVIAAMSAAQRHTLYVPFGFAGLHVFGKVSGEVMARAELRTQSNTDSVLADVDIWQGEHLTTRIVGLCLKPLNGDPRPDRGIYEIQWQEKRAGDPIASVGGPWLILSDDGAAAGEISRALAQSGHTSIVRSAGVSVGGIDKLRAIVRLYEPGQDLSADAAVGACSALLTLVCEILKQFPHAPPQLWLVTRGAANLSHSHVSGELAQSSVLGMARTIGMEHPELRCARIDIDASPISFGSIVKELEGWDGEDEIAFRDGRRFVPRLRRAAGDSAQLRRWKTVAGGSTESIEMEFVGRRAPAPGEIEVDVEVSALNFRDVLTTLGMYPGSPPLGLEFCGRVARIGKGVTSYRAGDRVAGIAWGSFCDSVCTPATSVFVVPPGLSSVEAVTLPNAFLTAWHCLRQLGKIKKGQRVLIHAASGGVGLAAVQLCRLVGVEVFATAGSDVKRDYLRGSGVTHVFSSRSLDFAGEINALTGGQGVDLVLNSLAGDFIAAGFSALRPGGCFIEIGKNAIWSEEQARSLRPDCGYFAVDVSSVIDLHPEIVQHHFASICELVARGEITALPFQVYDFEDTPLALRMMSQARHIGKIVLRHASPVAVRSDRTYLISGGLGAIGLCAARRLAALGARHLFLISRRPASDQALEAIRQIAQAGTEIVCRTSDVASRAEMAIVLNEIRESMPRLGGIVHAAGISDDGVIEQQTPERIRRVMAPKVAGALNLHELTLGVPLDFFLLFSSIASVTGSPAQAGYAAANAWMDALAHYRSNRGLPALSVNWGPWSGGGMAARLEAAGKRLSLPGLQPMAPDEYWKRLEYAQKRGRCQVAIAHVDWSRWAPIPSLLADLAATRQTPQTGTPSTELRIVERLANTPHRNRRALLLEYLRGQAGQILGLGASSFLDEHEPLFRIGMDSLMAVELRNQLSAALGRPLMATLLFDHPCLSSLADFLLEEKKAAEPNRDPLLDELQAMSEAEAEELLQQELGRL